MKLIGILAGLLLYWEAVYHVGCFGFSVSNPIFAIALIGTIAALESCIIGGVRGIGKKIAFWIITGLEYVWFCAEYVYYSIFKQPLLIEGAIRGGGDALTEFWKEALAGILKAIPALLIMAVPLVVVGVLIHMKKIHLPRYRREEVFDACVTAGCGLALAIVFIFVGKYINAEYYEEYTEFYDPLTVAENMGVTAMIQREAAVNISELGGNIWYGLTKKDSAGERESSESANNGPGFGQPYREKDETVSTDGTVPFTEETQEPEEPVVDTSPHTLPIDFEKLFAEASSKNETWLTEYMENRVPDNRNEYTGMFEGYNLIYLTAEGFCPYAVREDLTPTLYYLTHTGFVFTNYYVPLWATSTSDGEYVNLTGLIPDGQHSMRKSGTNDMAFSLPCFFGLEGVGSMAYHDNSLSFYDRYISHNNLGYIFKASRLGNLSEEEWGQYLIDMPYHWPSSDYEMMQATVPEYIGQDRFNIYYMTVSGHMYYSFSGNSMSARNKEAVSGLDMSENARAYIACHIELDKALRYLLEQLDEAGQLEKTVICLSADHYPYGMSQEEMDELAGKSVAENLDLYRNNLILWNASMKDEPVIVDKVCGAMDLMPTLLNLFGFDYDSRLFAGKDIFSEGEGIVVFKDRSFITDTVVYDRDKKTKAWRADLEASGALTNDIAGYASERGVSGIYDDYEASHDGASAEDNILRLAGYRQELESEEERDQYFSDCQQKVKELYNFSAYILENDYYHDIMEALPSQYRYDGNNPAKDWEPAEPLPPEEEVVG